MNQKLKVKEKETTISETTEPTRSGESETATTVLEESNAGIAHRFNNPRREKIGLGEYEPTKESFEQWDREADAAIEKGYSVEGLLHKMETDENFSPSPVENSILKKYISTLEAKIEENPSKELLEQQKRLATAVSLAGTKVARQLASRRGASDPMDNLSNFLLDKEISQGAPLSESQIREEKAKYSEVKKARKELKEAENEQAELDAKLIAEVGFNKAKALRRKENKKSHSEYKEERKKAVEGAREALKKIRTEDSALMSSVPFARQFKEIAAISPYVKDVVKSLIDEGYDKLDDVTNLVYAEFKDFVEGLSKKDIYDIIGGQYEKRDLTRNEKVSTIRLLKMEAKLLSEIEKAKKGESEAKGERKRVEYSRRVEELKKRLKEIVDSNKFRELIEEDSQLTETIKEGKTQSLREKNIDRKIVKLTKDLKDKKYSNERPEPLKLPISKKVAAKMARVVELEGKIKNERMKEEYAKRPKYIKWMDTVMKFIGLKRVVQSAIDLSVSFRQGGSLLSPRNIDVWAKAFASQLKSVFSPSKYKRIMYEIRRSPKYHEMIEDGVVFNDLEQLDPNHRNEDFQRSFIYDIPIVKEPFLASNRAADGFLNVARYELYNKLRLRLEKQGLTRKTDPKAFEDAARWAMNMTGRGNMLKMFESPASQRVLNNTFYGARLTASLS